VKIKNYLISGVIGMVVLFCIVFVYLHLDPEVTRDTDIWITNNSGKTTKVSIEYYSDVCPEKCKLELGKFAVNEGRGTSFATPGEGDFSIMAEFSDGMRITESGHYTEGWKFYPVIWKDRIETKSPF
jgi:hypothetical protein